MPSLGADMEAGTLVEWLVKPGDHVDRGDIVAVIETQKGAIEIEVFETGEIEQILVDLNAKVPVGTPLARIRTEREAQAVVAAVAPPGFALSAPPAAITAVPPGVAPATGKPIPAAPLPIVAQPRTTGRLRASPAARQLAELHHIDLSSIAGSGPAGAITHNDVEQSLRSISAAPERKAAGLDTNAMRTAIAAAMARSKQEIPHYYLEHQVDVTACEEWLSRTNAARPPDGRLLFGALAVKSVALAVRRFPAFNGFYRDCRFEPAAAAHIGVAIAIRGGGLAAPALHDADQLSLDGLMACMRDLIQRMRTGRIRSSEIVDPTITVSSLGERGVETLYGIIYPPQVAIVGFGKIVRRPWVVGGAVVPRSVVAVTLSADHRVSDGHAGALFLAEIGKLLQEPDNL
jgi:pyruvate dehydrogenase E2 component (dihydrolipoamide acetyltransferase)